MRYLLVTEQKLGQLPEIGFTTSISGILHLVYSNIYFHIYSQRSMPSPLSDIYQVSKHHCASFLSSNSKSIAPFNLVHSNIYLMKHKYEVCQIFVNFFRLVKNQFGKSVKRIQSNNDTEYVNLEFSDLVTYQVIIHELTCVNIPQQNEVAKGKRPCSRSPMYLITQFVCTDHISLQHRSFIAAIDAIKIPALVQEAKKDSNWIQAMGEEMKALERNSTWDIVDKRVIGCRWIYTMKCKSDGTLNRYKAR
ncbi:putative mitochondrial protein, partial [Mucuna pruriens]